MGHPITHPNSNTAQRGSTHLPPTDPVRATKCAGLNSTSHHRPTEFQAQSDPATHTQDAATNRADRFSRCVGNGTTTVAHPNNHPPSNTAQRGSTHLPTLTEAIRPNMCGGPTSTRHHRLTDFQAQSDRFSRCVAMIPQGFLAQQEMFKEGLMAPPVLSPSGPQCHHLLHYLGQQLIAVPRGVAPYHGPPLGTPQQTTRLNSTPQLCLD